MTVNEAVANYGTETYAIQSGDNLTRIVDRLYGSRDSIYFYVLASLNPGLDWFALNPAVTPTIVCLPKEACFDIYEVTG